MIKESPDNLNQQAEPGDPNCSVCRNLLANLERFFTMLETARHDPQEQWLTVEDVAKELKISRSIVYRLIRNGELEAVNIVANQAEFRQKGHYRVKRSCLNEYLASRRIKRQPSAKKRSRPRGFPAVKNHLRL